MLQSDIVLSVNTGIDVSKVEQRAWRGAIEEYTKALENHPNNLQNIHTPFSLCSCIINKLKESTDFEGKTFLVLNLELVEILVYDFGVSRDRIWFVTDCDKKADILKHERYKGVNTISGDFLKWETDMKFDNVVMNPPYQNQQVQKGEKRGGGASLWDRFVEKAVSLTKENGYICAIHPSMWRKPESKCSKNKGLWNSMTEKQIVYLEIHNIIDGKKVFNAGTRYDWYVMQNKPCENSTIVIDEDGVKNKLDLRNWDFLPNKNFIMVKDILATGSDISCKLIWNTFYHTAIGRYDYVSEIKSEEFRYPLIHSTNKDGSRFYWTNFKNKDHFGVPKVIFGESGINDCVIDMNGEYGMTQGAMAIMVDSMDEAINIKKALESEKFKILLESVSWGNFRIDWRLFKYFRKDFWKDFV